jgi:hypothetical protein
MNTKTRILAIVLGFAGGGTKFGAKGKQSKPTLMEIQKILTAKRYVAFTHFLPVCLRLLLKTPGLKRN